MVVLLRLSADVNMVMISCLFFANLFPPKLVALGTAALDDSHHRTHKHSNHAHLNPEEQIGSTSISHAHLA